MATKKSSNEIDESQKEVKLWFQITMACTAVFVTAVFLFII